jgi:multiple RNA-binding domain-containing protein 1
VAKPDLNKPGPSKHLQEFLQVMKGDETSGNIPVEDAAVPGDAGWKADGLKTVGKEKKSVKGKERDDTPPSAVAEQSVEDDDDAAWLKKRQKALEVDGADDAAPAPVSSRVRPRY